MKAAIKASVLPVGSFSIKQKTQWSITLNAWVGAYYDIRHRNKSVPRYGLTAPMGISFAKGFGRSGNGGALSLNLNLLDLGALVNYYFVNGDTASLPDKFTVRLSNIFSPGAGMSYTIPRTPLTISGGGQWIPTLFRIEQMNGQNEAVRTTGFRWYASLLIDIPMFTLFSKDFKHNRL